MTTYLSTKKPIVFTPLLIFILVLYCSFCQGQQLKTDTLTTYEVGKLQQDFTLFRQILEKAHPSLHRYTPLDSIEECFNKGYQQINRPMNDLEFWELLQRIAARINSGHTAVAFNQQLNNFYTHGGRSVLPFYVYIRNKRLFIKGYAARADTAYKIGDQILQINGVAADQLIDQLRALVPGEGLSNVYKDYKLESYDFYLLYNMLYDDQEEFTVQLKTQRGIEVKKIKAVKRVIKVATSGKGPNQPIAANEPAIPTITYPPTIDSAAVLRIPNFVYKDYQAVHKSLFKEINSHAIRNLIIDVRDNPGGDGNTCIDLLKYLLKDRFYLLGYKEYAIDTARFIPVVNSINKQGKYDLSSVVHDPTFLHNFSAFNPNYSTFDGNIYIITDGGSFSAASLFAVALKNQRKCVVVGQETGGGEVGTDGLKILEIKLPNTKLVLRLPLYWTYSASASQNEGHGLIPDIKVNIGAKQIYEQRYLAKDPALEVIKQTIAGSARP